MSRGELIPPFADQPITITQATNGNIGTPGQILVGIWIASSTSGTLTIATTKFGTLVSAMPVSAGQFIQFPLKISMQDQLTMTGGGTFAGVVLMGNP